MNIQVKKAQLSIFVVIASILVLGLLVLIGMNYNKINIFTEDKSTYKVKEFVESCLDLETKNAINKLGLKNGWLYSPTLTYTDRANSQEYNQKAQGLDFLEKNKIPYWYYYDDIAEEFKINIPPYDTDNQYSIRNQLKRYIDENLEENCIHKFEAFTDIYNIDYEPENINTTVDITNSNEIIVSLELPIIVTEANSNISESIQTYQITTENKLFIPYLLARDIVLAEANSSFIEKRILHQIAPYQSSHSRDLLPPFYDFRQTYDFRPWDLIKTKEVFKQIVNGNIRSLQFFNTDYQVDQLAPQLQDSEFAQSLNTIHTKDYISQTSLTKIENPRIFREYKNYEVTPKYEPFFPTFFSISPSMGNIILLPKPQSIINLIPIFFTEYVAVYEVTMPILFEIKASEDNSDFVFNLAIETNIDHNSALRENIDFTFDIESLGLTSPPKTLICDPPQFISAPITLNISDPINYGERKPDGPKIGVEDAIVTFDCKDIATCYITQTQINGKYITNNITQLNLSLPINCNPGTLEIYKYGHQKITIKNVDPTLDKPINLGEYEMASTKKVKINLNLLNSGQDRYSSGSSLGKYDRAFIIFTSLEQKDFVQAVEITLENENKLDIELLPSNYSIQGFVIYENEINIPEEQFCYKSGVSFFGGGGEDCETIPSMTLDAWTKGGIELEQFEVTTKDLLNYDELTINLFDFGIPSSFSSLQSSSDSMSNLKEISKSIEPYFE